MKCKRHTDFGIEPNEFSLVDIVFVENGMVPGIQGMKNYDAYCGHCIKKVRKKIPIDETSK